MVSETSRQQSINSFSFIDSKKEEERKLIKTCSAKECHFDQSVVDFSRLLFVDDVAIFMKTERSQLSMSD